MPVITRLEPQKRSADRVNVFVDGEFACGVSLLVAASHQLMEGRTISERDLAVLRSDDDVEKALARALNFLSFRARSAQEVSEYMRRKGVDPEVASAVMQRLERMNLVDDAEFSKFWVENRQTFRPRGTRALRWELRRKGVDAETVDHALQDVTNEEQTAYEAGRQKVRSLAALNDSEFFRRMSGFLQRRGFPYAAVRVAAGRLLRERNAEADE